MGVHGYGNAILMVCKMRTKLIFIDGDSADFSLFDDLKKKVDLSQESGGTLNRYQPIRATENPYDM
jgi:hypothetical protein